MKIEIPTEETAICYDHLDSRILKKENRAWINLEIEKKAENLDCWVYKGFVNSISKYSGYCNLRKTVFVGFIPNNSLNKKYKFDTYRTTSFIIRPIREMARIAITYRTAQVYELALLELLGREVYLKYIKSKTASH